MPKKETKDIQEELLRFGEQLGFRTYKERRVHSSASYAPVYDVIWYLELDKIFDFSKLEPLFKNDQEWMARLKNLPFAGFEIEGSATTSKNQLGNFANIYSGNFLYGFVIVNNGAANGENDTYRRGIKLHRYFSEAYGNRNVFFLDQTHLFTSMARVSNFSPRIAIDDNVSGDRGTFGGETASVSIYEKIQDIINGSGLTIKQNFAPPITKIRYAMLKECFSDLNSDRSKFILTQNFHFDPQNERIMESKRVSDSLYIPKLDLVMGFQASPGFTDWLHCMADALKDDHVHYPLLYGLKNRIINELFIPLISIEIEATLNKHLNGGICNMANYSYVGVVVTNKDAASHVEYFRRHLGIQNVISYCVEE
ncbi:MAG: hypothetical protein ABRQ23_00740 [Syntrophomonadaceae bacterium]